MSRKSARRCTWRTRLLTWHILEGSLWGLIAIALLGVSGSEWRMTIVTAAIVYGFTIMLVTIHDWAVAFAGSMPVLLLVAIGLAAWAAFALFLHGPLIGVRPFG